jgi:hypothetical protein
MNLSTVPPCLRAIAGHLGEILVEEEVISSGCRRSVVAVKSLISEKKIVSSLRSV